METELIPSVIAHPYQTEPSEDEHVPSARSRGILVLSLLAMLMPMQVVFGLVLIRLSRILPPISGLDYERTFTFQSLSFSEADLMVILLAAALSGIATAALAFVWPGLWYRLTQQNFTLATWLAWRPSARIPLWSIPFLTIGYLLVVSAIGTQMFGEAEVELQQLLFQTSILHWVGVVTVLVAAVAEELVFRGALYNLLLAFSHKRLPTWQQHILPFAVAGTSFAAIHLLAGFESLAAIVQVTLLSIYISLLRAITGSVKASLVAHMTWNLLAAFSLIALSIYGDSFALIALWE